jgi:hypothetical protein
VSGDEPTLNMESNVGLEREAGKFGSHLLLAHELLTRGTEVLSPRKQSADAWFENDDAGEFEFLEQCVASCASKTLSYFFA